MFMCLLSIVGASIQEKALVRALSVIVKSSRTFVWSSEHGAVRSQSGSREEKTENSDI